MKKWLLLITAMASFAIISCSERQPGPDDTTSGVQELTMPDWLKSAVLYEVNTRQFSEEGTFDAITSELSRLDEMGIDIIWLMPVHPISEKKRKATGDMMVEEIEDPAERKKYLGSPYAVADYKGLNPDYGDAEDFRELVRTAHSLGMKVIIDWVPNHTGWDNSWIENHPEWYTTDAEGNIIDPIDYNTGKSWGWTDVADLDYGNREMRDSMIEAMRFWLETFDIDGFRVDVAHGIPQDFWDEMTPALRETKEDIFLLAESQVESHRNRGTFHATYGWDFHHLMNEIAHGEKTAADVKSWYDQDTARFGPGFHIHFTSNHDENTWAGTVFDRMGDAHKTFAVLAATLDGMPLLYNGQEEPLRKRLEFFVKDPIEWSEYAYSKFYKSLFELKENQSALWNGDEGSRPEFIHAGDQVLAYRRADDQSDVVIVLNLSAESASFEPGFDPGTYNELYGHEIVLSDAGQMDLAPWAYYIFYK